MWRRGLQNPVPRALPFLCHAKSVACITCMVFLGFACSNAYSPRSFHGYSCFSWCHDSSRPVFKEIGSGLFSPLPIGYLGLCVNTLWQTSRTLLCGSLVRRMLFLLACIYGSQVWGTVFLQAGREFCSPLSTLHLHILKGTC